MRLLMLSFVTAWITGILMGVVGKTLVLPATILAVFLALLLQRKKAPIIVAIVSLLSLGFIYGSVGSENYGACNSLELTSGVVKSVVTQEERVQYVVQSSGSCTFLVNASRWPLLEKNSTVTVAGGKIRLVKDFSQEFIGYRKFLEAQGISAIVSFPKLRLVSFGSSSAPSSISQKFKLSLQQEINQLFVEPNASVVSAMLLAEKGSLPDELSEQLRQTGTSHVLAISGLHVGIFAAFLFAILYLLPLSSLTRATVVVVCLWIYIFMIGAPVSSRRAGLFISLAAIAFNFGLLTSLPTILLLTALTLVSINPAILLNVGFQLSVFAVLGIFLSLFLFQRQDRKPWYTSLVISFGASVATWPIVIYHFGIFSPISIVANLFAVPLVTIIVPLAIVAIALSYVFMPIALLLANVVSGLLTLLTIVGQVFSSIPFAYFPEVEPPLMLVPIYYLILTAIIYWLMKKKHKRLVEMLVP